MRKEKEKLKMVSVLLRTEKEVRNHQGWLWRSLISCGHRTDTTEYQVQCLVVTVAELQQDIEAHPYQVSCTMAGALWGRCGTLAYGIRTFGQTCTRPRTTNLHNLPSLWRQPLLLPSFLPMLRAFQCMHLGQKPHHDSNSLRSPSLPPLIASKPIMRVRAQQKPMENTRLVLCSIPRDVEDLTNLCPQESEERLEANSKGIWTRMEKYKAWLGGIYWYACIHPMFVFNELAQAPGSGVNSLLG